MLCDAVTAIEILMTETFQARLMYLTLCQLTPLFFSHTSDGFVMEYASWVSMHSDCIAIKAAAACSC